MGKLACCARSMCQCLQTLLPGLRRSFPGSVYLCGGRGSDGSELAKVTCLELTSRSWAPVTPMIARRCGAAAGVVAGMIYVCGGSVTPFSLEDDEDDVMLASAERLRPGASEWEALPEMQLARDGASAGVLGGKLYICGGRASSDLCLSSIERFDPKAHLWEGWGVLPLMSQQRVCLAAAALDGALYVIGGRDAASYSAERLFPNRDHVAWQQLPPLHRPRWSASACSLGGHLYVCGGILNAPHLELLNSVERFCPQTYLWEEVTYMGMQRARLAATAGLGQLLCFGGSGENELSNQTAETYDTESNTWSPLPVLLEPCEFAVAVVVHG
ncbi:unnamed protein product [Polarella glacialis]|uniref:Uncharacterized protein n=1 Tax=Polarella glacialis TaxID=89957 RepID=A0A813DE39_POLGL|nr:unnamed protein product [Polarella glacialis]